MTDHEWNVGDPVCIPTSGGLRAWIPSRDGVIQALGEDVATITYDRPVWDRIDAEYKTECVVPIKSLQKRTDYNRW